MLLHCFYPFGLYVAFILVNMGIISEVTIVLILGGVDLSLDLEFSRIPLHISLKY
jgi:hypothetical protein